MTHTLRADEDKLKTGLQDGIHYRLCGMRLECVYGDICRAGICAIILYVTNTVRLSRIVSNLNSPRLFGGFSKNGSLVKFVLRFA